MEEYCLVTNCFLSPITSLADVISPMWQGKLPMPFFDGHIGLSHVTVRLCRLKRSAKITYWILTAITVS